MAFLGFLLPLAKADEGLLMPREEKAVIFALGLGVETMMSGLLEEVDGGAIADRFIEDSKSLNSWYNDLDNMPEGGHGGKMSGSPGGILAGVEATFSVKTEPVAKLAVLTVTLVVVVTR